MQDINKISRDAISITMPWLHKRRNVEVRDYSTPACVAVNGYTLHIDPVWVTVEVDPIGPEEASRPQTVKALMCQICNEYVEEE